MKKSIFNIALLSMLFIMGACSTDPDKTPDKEIPESSTTVFLNSVKTKDAFQSEKQIGTFATDGKTFVVDGAFLTLEVSGTLIFESASSGTEAIYTDTSAKEVVITLTTDGGTITVDTTETIFTYVSVVDPDPNATAFLNNVKGSEARLDIYFEVPKVQAVFSADGREMTGLLVGDGKTAEFTSITDEVATYTITDTSTEIIVYYDGSSSSIKVGDAPKVDVNFYKKGAFDLDRVKGLKALKKSDLSLVATFSADGTEMTIPNLGIAKLDVGGAYYSFFGIYSITANGTTTEIFVQTSSYFIVIGDAPKVDVVFADPNVTDEEFLNNVKGSEARLDIYFEVPKVQAVFSADGREMTGLLVGDGKTAEFTSITDEVATYTITDTSTEIIVYYDGSSSSIKVGDAPKVDVNFYKKGAFDLDRVKGLKALKKSDLSLVATFSADGTEMTIPNLGIAKLDVGGAYYSFFGIYSITANGTITEIFVQTSSYYIIIGDAPRVDVKFE